MYLSFKIIKVLFCLKLNFSCSVNDINHAGVPLAYSEQKSKKFTFLHGGNYFSSFFILNF